MNIAEVITDRRERLVEAMLEAADRTLPTPEPEARQFMVGFVRVLEMSARGDHSVRELYLSSVIPALRAGNMPLDVVIGGMIRVSVAAAVVLGPEHMRWIADFCADYTARLLALWQDQA